MPKEISKELIRQIDIISMVHEKPGFYTDSEIANYFGESVSTVRRDFAKIREIGIDLHSSKRFLTIIERIPTKLLNKLINTYLVLNDTETIKNLQQIRKIFKDKTLRYFVNIVKSISLKNIIQFEYEKDENKIVTTRRVTPIGFIKTNRSFLFIGLENDELDRVRFYLIEKMRNIYFTSDKSSHKNLPNMYEFLKDSWGFYQSGEVQDVEILFSRSCTGIKNRVFVNKQEIKETSKGIVFKARLKVSREFISWILGWGGKCKVIKPVSLRKEIIRTAKDIINKY